MSWLIHLDKLAPAKNLTHIGTLSRMTVFMVESDEEMYLDVAVNTSTCQTLEGRVFLSWEGRVQMTPFQAPQTHSGSFHENAGRYEIPQLASGYQSRELESDVLPEHTPSRQGRPYLDSHFHKEIRAIQEENASLLQS